MLGGLRQRRDALNSRGPGSHECDDLVLEAGQGGIRPAARVPVVPPCRVERGPSEFVHARNRGQLQEVQDPGRQDVPPAVELIATVGADPPATTVLAPLGLGHPGVEQGVRHEVEFVGDRLEVVEDLRAGGIAPRRNVAQLLEHRDVDVRLDVAHHARVAVPVPGASHAARLVDDPDALHPRLAEVDAARMPAIPPPTMTASTSSRRGSRSTSAVNGSAR